MRLIDWDKVLEWMHRQKETTEQWSMRIAIENYVDDMPTVDAVTVVRCKDCKHNKTLQKGTFGDILGYDGECAIVRMLIKDNYYCVWGERREDK